MLKAQGCKVHNTWSVDACGAKQGFAPEDQRADLGEAPFAHTTALRGSPARSATPQGLQRLHPAAQPDPGTHRGGLCSGTQAEPFVGEESVPRCASASLAGIPGMTWFRAPPHSRSSGTWPASP